MAIHRATRVVTAVNALACRAKIEGAFAGLRGWRLLLWPAAPILIYAVVLQPHFPNTNPLIDDWYAHCVSFTMFVYGWWLGKSDALWQELVRLRKAH